MAQSAHSDTNHLPIPNQAAPTAIPAPIVIPKLAIDGSMPIICNAIINQ